jgi:gas vesicle protein GvpO
MAQRDSADRDDADRRDADQGNGDRGRPRRRSSRTAQITAAEAGRAGMEQIAELTGKQPESVTGVEPAEDGWLVTVEVIEDRRIPSSTDILSTYETELTPDGDLISYRRQRRYARGHGDMTRG